MLQAIYRTQQGRLVAVAGRRWESRVAAKPRPRPLCVAIDVGQAATCLSEELAQRDVAESAQVLKEDGPHSRSGGSPKTAQHDLAAHSVELDLAAGGQVWES